MSVTVVMVVESTSVSSFKNNLGTVYLSRFLTVVYCYAVYIQCESKKIPPKGS